MHYTIPPISKIVKKIQMWRGLEVDGVYGSVTASNFSMIPNSWDLRRKIIAAFQTTAYHHGWEVWEIDGYWGPQTDFVWHEATGSEDDIFSRPTEQTRKVKKGWPHQNEMLKYYGAVGKDQTMLKLPYIHRLAWAPDQYINRFSCHKRVKGSLRRVLVGVLQHYGNEGIQKLGLDLFGGCLNVRHMRGGNAYSTHSWGAAVDYHPAGNPFRAGKDKAVFARPEYDAWWTMWDAEGWVSLGRERNFDWMHIQAAVL